jgi:hypothetical protein
MTTQKTIIHKLRLLQDNILDIAAEIDYYGGFNTELQDVKKRLLLQAAQTEMWADNIETMRDE